MKFSARKPPIWCMEITKRNLQKFPSAYSSSLHSFLFAPNNFLWCLVNFHSFEIGTNHIGERRKFEKCALVSFFSLWMLLMASCWSHLRSKYFVLGLMCLVDGSPHCITSIFVWQSVAVQMSSFLSYKCHPMFFCMHLCLMYLLLAYGHGNHYVTMFFVGCDE